MSAEAREALTHYAVGSLLSLDPAGGTAGRCWRVGTTAGRFLLRRRGSRTSSPEAMSFDHGLRRHLVVQGVPTSAPVAAIGGETWVVTGVGAFELHPFVEGRAFAREARQLTETALALARFHRAASCYAGRGTFTPAPAQFAMAAPEVGGTARTDDPALIAAALRNRRERNPELAYAAEQAARLAREYPAELYAGLPRWLIHGDYHAGNLLYSETGTVIGVFDLDWACEDTRCRDLADLLYFFAGRRDGPVECGRIESLTAAAEIDLGMARSLLRSYQQVLPLAPEEVRAIPLAIRARWLAMRLEGSAKLPAERRDRFIGCALGVPLQWVERWGGELTRQLT